MAAPAALTAALVAGLAALASWPATGVAAGDTVRILAGSAPLRDAAGHRWQPAGSRVDGRRVPIRRALQITATPALYATLAHDPRRARLRLPRPGRYAVTLYLAHPRGSLHSRRFRVSAGGVWHTVDLPAGSGLQRPVHTAFETVVRGRSLTLRFRGVRGRPVLAAVEAQRLGPVGLPPVAEAFREDFSGARGALPDLRVWEPMTGFGWGATQLQAYTDRPANIALDGHGRLRITARREAYVDGNGNGKPADYTSGRIESRATFTLQRTRIQARIRVPGGPGLWPTFWASGVEPPVWPASGEVDIMEFAGQRPALLYGFVHGPLPGGSALPYQNGAVRQATGSFAAASHVYGIRTEPNVVEFLVDGRRYGSVSRADIPAGSPWLLSRPYRLVLNLAIGGFGGPLAARTPIPARMVVDSVTVAR